MRNNAFSIVAIGASAGGVEALQGFFHGLPPDPEIGVVIVTHLNPTRESKLPEILAESTKLPVHVAQHEMEVLPNAVYVMPAGAVLGIQNGRLQLRKQIPGRHERKPIDVFFSALAGRLPTCPADSLCRALPRILHGYLRSRQALSAIFRPETMLKPIWSDWHLIGTATGPFRALW